MAGRTFAGRILLDTMVELLRKYSEPVPLKVVAEAAGVDEVYSRRLVRNLVAEGKVRQRFRRGPYMPLFDSKGVPVLLYVSRPEDVQGPYFVLPERRVPVVDSRQDAQESS